jgi:hypothetical protein
VLSGESRPCGQRCPDRAVSGVLNGRRKKQSAGGIYTSKEFDMKKTWLLFLTCVSCSTLTQFAQDAAQNAGNFQTALGVTITGYN